MTVWECMRMLGHDEKVRISNGNGLITEPFSSFEFEHYVEEYPREIFDIILERQAKSIDLEQMIIYCED